MAIEAIYAVNEYLRSKVEAEGLSFGDMYPGRFAPSVENDTKFVTYSVMPTETYDLYALKQDFVTYRFYNPDFDELHKINKIVFRTFNVYDIEQTALSEPSIIFQEASYRTVGDGEASFAEGVDYFFLTGELKLQYTETIFASMSTNLFIEGN